MNSQTLLQKLLPTTISKISRMTVLSISNTSITVRSAIKTTHIIPVEGIKFIVGEVVYIQDGRYIGKVKNDSEIKIVSV